MPYIKAEDRLYYKLALMSLVQDLRGKPAGHLNYVITKIIHHYLGTEYGYEDLNRIVGVLESVKAEFQRKLVAPYEDIKENINGPI